MTTKLAKDLKKKIVGMSAEMFEPLTFGELNEHDRFIFVPPLGDKKNQRRGFRTIYYLYIKNTKFELGVNARRRKDGSPIKIEDYDTPVIKVE